MADFAVTVERLSIRSHPNADLLEVALIGDYQAIVRKGDFVTCRRWDGNVGVTV